MRKGSGSIIVMYLLVQLKLMHTQDYGDTQVAASNNGFVEIINHNYRA